jgi:hydrogenase expression/formation protein HypC
MCLAVPMKLVEAEGTRGIVSVDGVRREVRLDLVEAHVGDWVLVHAGYAIQVEDEASAAETLALLRQLLPPGEPGPA